MGAAEKIIEAMREAVPAARPALNDAEAATLRRLTRELVEARAGAAAEYERYRSIARRELCLPEEAVTRRLKGATVLVTGGTGCVGSALMAQVARRRPGRLVSVSRGLTCGWPLQSGAEYRHADIARPAAIRALIAEIRPDVIFHVAGQRSPAQGESDVPGTVSANVLGTRNVLTAAAETGVPQVVCASTGKALRPYSPEVYTASKRAAEWISASLAGATSMRLSAARFTHVVDNSIVHQRFLTAARSGGPEVPVGGPQGSPTGIGGREATQKGGREARVSPDHAGDRKGAKPPWEVLRLHGEDIAFYAQSAVESAQLLLVAMAGAVAGEFRVHAITDLGWPVSLLDVAVGILRETGSATPLYISGYDPGYEEVAFPGLYDPATAGDASPLLNAFEVAAAGPSPCPRTDAFRLDLTPPPAARKLLDALAEACGNNPRYGRPGVLGATPDHDIPGGTADHGAARQALDDLSWLLLDGTLAAADPGALSRCAALLRRHEDAMSGVHRRVADAIRTRVAALRHASDAVPKQGWLPGRVPV